MYKINLNQYNIKYNEFVKSSLERIDSHLGDYSDEAMINPSARYLSKSSPLKNSVYERS